jgi:hypothetical protein
MQQLTGLCNEERDDEFQEDEVERVMDPAKYFVTVFAEAADAVNWALAHRRDHLEAYKFIRDLRAALDS